MLKCTIADLPPIINWPMDGGAFITMPQVFTQEPGANTVLNSNVGMYRIQLTGNNYIPNAEIGLHYQLHRGIGIHQLNANKAVQPLRVSIFVGGPPAHSVAAVMPLPEGLPEVAFAGVLGNRRFRYFIDTDGFVVSADADFVITGTVHENVLKPEGPFGDHLGYYSLTHLFPVLRVKSVYRKSKPIWNFTVVGRPPQEDTAFGALIHEITGNAINKEVPGVTEINAVDAAGVHPLLLAIGTERYTPYAKTTRPQEILTQANRILGTNQLSLAKYIFIANKADNPPPTTQIADFITFMIERCDYERDLHFQTKTTIDTLDYSGEGLNEGSKLVVAAVGEPVRTLGTRVPDALAFLCAKFLQPGILCVSQASVRQLKSQLTPEDTRHIGLIVVCDDADFASASLNNFLWVTFTRSNPASDVYGLHEFTNNKHWGCKGPLIIDATIKPHHAPVLVKDEEAENFVDKLAHRYPQLRK